MGENFDSNVTVTRPVSKPVTGTSVPSQDYDYGYYYYCPICNLFGLFRFIFLAIVVGLIIFFAIQCLIYGIFALIVYRKKRYYTCPVCKKTFKSKTKRPPNRCYWCGADMTPPKCP